MKMFREASTRPRKRNRQGPRPSRTSLKHPLLCHAPAALGGPAKVIVGQGDIAERAALSEPWAMYRFLFTPHIRQDIKEIAKKIHPVTGTLSPVSSWRRTPTSVEGLPAP